MVKFELLVLTELCFEVCLTGSRISPCNILPHFHVRIAKMCIQILDNIVLIRRSGLQFYPNSSQFSSNEFVQLYIPIWNRFFFRNWLKTNWICYSSVSMLMNVIIMYNIDNCKLSRYLIILEKKRFVYIITTEPYQ